MRHGNWNWHHRDLPQKKHINTNSTLSSAEFQIQFPNCLSDFNFLHISPENRNPNSTMNFFKSVFADDPDPPSESSPKQSQSQSQSQDQDHPVSPPNPNPTSSTSPAWNFGGLLKTLSTKSESVIETYRRDLQEFSVGLKKEIEVAHGSLGTVGHAMDELGASVLKGTAQIISQGKDAILAVDLKSDSPSNLNDNLSSSNNDRIYMGYSRFEAQVKALQSDVNTYCNEPEDLDDFVKWRSALNLGKMGNVIQKLMEENGSIEDVYKRVVPGSVDEDTFWTRYFYRLHKLEEAEHVRARLVRRAISSEEEELSWDTYDDDEEEKEDGNENAVEKAGEKGENRGERSLAKEDNVVGKVLSDVSEIGDVGEKSGNVEKTHGGGDEGERGESGDVHKNEELGDGPAEKTTKEVNVVGEVHESPKAVDGGESVALESKVRNRPDGHEDVEKSSGISQDNAESIESAGSNLKEGAGQYNKSGAASSKAVEEEDLGWDEIEDLTSIDDQKLPCGENPSPNRAELRKRLSAAEEEEDLSWDIEDDDEPAKA